MLKSEDFQSADFSKVLLSKVRMLFIRLWLFGFYSPHVNMLLPGINVTTIPHSAPARGNYVVHECVT